MKRQGIGRSLAREFGLGVSDLRRAMTHVRWTLSLHPHDHVRRFRLERLMRVLAECEREACELTHEGEVQAKRRQRAA